MKNALIALMLPLFAWATNASCSQAPKTLTVKTMKTDLAIPFTDQTTIGTVKQAIQASEGIPVTHQRLTKSEGLSWGLFKFPKQVTVTLEDSQSCGHYDLQHNQQVNLSIFLKKPKTQAQIDAELQARREAIASAVLHKPLLPSLVGIAAEYDTHNED